MLYTLYIGYALAYTLNKLPLYYFGTNFYEQTNMSKQRRKAWCNAFKHKTFSPTTTIHSQPLHQAKR